MTDQTPIQKGDLFLTEEEIDALPKFRWLIKDVLPETGIALLFAKPGEGKSFLAIDLAEGIAHGQSAWGQKFEPGSVLYIAAEGMRGVGKRFKGWRICNGNLRSGKNLLVLPQAVDFTNAKSVSEFSESLKRRIDRQSEPLKLVVIDTLSRCFGSDENTQAGMSTFISNVQKDIVDRFNCLALILHHTSRADPTKPRGSNVNDGAADTMLLVTKEDDGQLVTVVKQKEGEDGVGLFFRRREIELPSDDGEIETTLVMTYEGHRAGAKAKRKPSKVTLACQLLAAAGKPLTRDEWHEEFKKAGLETPGRGERTFREAFKELTKEGGPVRCNDKVNPATYSTS